MAGSKSGTGRMIGNALARTIAWEWSARQEVGGSAVRRCVPFSRYGRLVSLACTVTLLVINLAGWLKRLLA